MYLGKKIKVKIHTQNWQIMNIFFKIFWYFGFAASEVTAAIENQLHYRRQSFAWFLTKLKMKTIVRSSPVIVISLADITTNSCWGILKLCAFAQPDVSAFFWRFPDAVLFADSGIWRQRWFSCALISIFSHEHLLLLLLFEFFFREFGCFLLFLKIFLYFMNCEGKLSTSSIWKVHIDINLTYSMFSKVFFGY